SEYGFGRGPRAPFCFLRFLNHGGPTIPPAMVRRCSGRVAGAPMLSTLALFIFPVLMAYAASSDLLTMRIANWLVLTVAGSYFVLVFFAQLPLPEIGMSVVAAAIVLAVAFAFFAVGWIGGGDAKLVAAT